MDKRSTFFVLITLLFLNGFAASSGAGEIVAIKSAEIKPYNDALEGFKTSCGHDVREVVMAEAESSDILRKVHESGTVAVFAIGMDALNLARSVRDIPVIYAMVPNSLTLSSGPKPLSGVSMYIPPDRYIGSILDVFHGARRIGVIYDPRNSEAYVREALQSAQGRGVELVLRKASRPSDIPALVDSMKDKIDVFWMLPDTTVINPETVKYLLLFSFRNKVPTFTFSKKYVEMGSTAGLYTAPFDIGVQAGEIARKLVAEKNPKTIRTDARSTVLAVNTKIIKKFGIKVRDDILNRAENVD
jgi:putative ABC transport system substrate-binding protein